MKKLINNPKTARTAGLMLPLIALAVTSFAHAEDFGSPYTMTVFSDDSYGRLVTGGDYATAIDKISSRGERRRMTFEAQTNLCVAYTKSGELEKADAACNTAVAKIQPMAERMLKRRSTPEYVAQGYREYLALALANRGVLHAVRGDASDARADFLRASELDTELPVSPETNLARLERSN
ncbi:MAG: hypothetical protein HKN77_10360 [Woeseiaceae bacterium]|nr:hypothetical protein [Woeseiaceae bacterium]